MNSTKPTRLHVALNTSDLESSVAFYRDLFGSAPAKLRADYVKFDVADPPVNFTLNAGPAPPPGAGRLSHLGIEVQTRATLEGTRERIRRAGRPMRVEEATLCCCSVQEKFWVRDPDGNDWGFFLVLDPDPVEAEKGCAC